MERVFSSFHVICINQQLKVTKFPVDLTNHVSAEILTIGVLTQGMEAGEANARKNLRKFGQIYKKIC